MDKKGIAFKSLVYLMITLVVFFIIIYIFFLSPRGLNAATKIGVGIGLSKLPTKPGDEKKSIEELPTNVKDVFDSLYNAMKYGAENENSDCLIKYETFPEEIKDNNIKIEESESGLSLTALNKLGQVRLQKTIPGLKHCYYISLGEKLEPSGIIINEKDKINVVDSDIDYKDITISGTNYKLLYKEYSDICFLTNCDNDCLDDMMFIGKFDFCNEGESYKNIFIDVLFDGTSYGNIEDWVTRGSRRDYKFKEGKFGVAHIFSEGIDYNRFKRVFDISKVEHPSELKLGVWYNGKYYGTKDDWCYYERFGSDYWQPTNAEIDYRRVYVLTNNVLEKVFDLTGEYGIINKPCS